MEIYQLRTFVAVAQQGHLTQAAELLHLSQPAVTAQIKALEEEIGLPLFERSASGVSLTLVGQSLLPKARDIIANTQRLAEYARALKQQLNGTLTIGVSMISTAFPLGGWVQPLLAEHQLLDLRLQHLVTAQALSMVKKNELDGAFFLGRNPYQHLHAIVLADCRFRIVASPSLLRRFPQLAYTALDALPWVGLSPFSSLGLATQELWREMNIHPATVCRSDHHEELLALIVAGVGVGIAELCVAEPLLASGELVALVEREVHLPYQFIYAVSRQHEQLMQVLLSSIRAMRAKPAPIGRQTVENA